MPEGEAFRGSLAIPCAEPTGQGSRTAVSATGPVLMNVMTPIMRNARMADMIKAKTRNRCFLANLQGRQEPCKRGADVIGPVCGRRTPPVLSPGPVWSGYPPNRPDELNARPR